MTAAKGFYNTERASLVLNQMKTVDNVNNRSQRWIT